MDVAKVKEHLAAAIDSCNDDATSYAIGFINAALAMLEPKKLEWKWGGSVWDSNGWRIAVSADGNFDTFQQYMMGEMGKTTFSTLAEAKQFCQLHHDAQVPSEDAKLRRVRDKAEAMRADFKYVNDNNIQAYENGRSNGGNNAIGRFIAIIDAELKGV